MHNKYRLEAFGQMLKKTTNDSKGHNYLLFELRISANREWHLV